MGDDAVRGSLSGAKRTRLAGSLAGLRDASRSWKGEFGDCSRGVSCDPWFGLRKESRVKVEKFSQVPEPVNELLVLLLGKGSRLARVHIVTTAP